MRGGAFYDPICQIPCIPPLSQGVGHEIDKCIRKNDKLHTHTHRAHDYYHVLIHQGIAMPQQTVITRRLTTGKVSASYVIGPT